MKRQALFKDAFSYVAANAAVQAFGFLGVYLLMRNYSLSDFGFYSYVVEFIAIFQFFSDAGLTNYAVRELSMPDGNKQMLYSRLQGAQVLISSLLIAVVVIVSVVTQPVVYWRGIWAAGSGMVVLSLLAPANALLIAGHRRELLLRKNLLDSLVILFFFSIGVYFRMNIGYFFFALIVRALFLGLFFAVVRLKDRELFFIGRFSVRVRDFLGVITPGIAFTILMVANIIYNKVDILMIGHYLAKRDVALYAGALRFITPFMFISGAVMTIVFPYLVKSFFKDKSDFRDDLWLSFRWMALTGLLLSLALTFGGSYIFHFLFGEKFDGSLPVFYILVWYLAIVFAYGTFSNAIVAIGKIRLLILVNIGMMIFKIVLNSFAIKCGGIRGAAWVTLAAELMILVVTFFIVRKERVHG